MDSNGFVDRMLEVVNKVSNQRHVSAVRDGFVALIPVTIIASFWILINNLFLDPANGLLRNVQQAQQWIDLGNQIYNSTLGILGILIAASIGYKLAISYGEDSLFGAVMGIISFFLSLPATVTLADIEGNEVTVAAYTEAQISATGMFLAIMMTLISVTLLAKFSSMNILKIKMPDSVPPAISKSFNVLIPAFLVTLILGLVEVLVIWFVHVDIPTLVEQFFQAPLVASLQSLGGVLLYVALSNFLWVFGLHGTFILGSIGEPLMLTAIQENMNALQNGEALPHIITKPFIDSFAWMGGGGMLMCLVIAIYIGSRREDHRSIAKVGGIPIIFNVSEPVMFGLPVIFNPLLGVPLIVVPLVTTTIAYYATQLGVIAKTSVLIPWTTPPIISGYLATNGDWKASVLQVILLIIGVLIYLPFVHLANKEKV
ncbi:PTS sugar transporter subunit IIC [Tetragenococcus halophilus]|uniref:PTS sugar transporter subunit IIC n=1 Tax=Tetragenococcus halophilus TaxID=51669 RepID=UPI00209B7F67|nr:PTS sugar transporter subunit IIC [Tetragenococcus halophilus]MCO8289109.1 PTS sugar transporter subunit IIC [Tetragenococcus halophilus]MDN6724279.1 PTS sugar transporter subunit IIC [Tetragenococcus halophilus]